MAELSRAQDRLTLLLSLVPYLLDHDEGVEVAALARRFGVREQRVRDAVALIAVSGVPGDSRQYQHGDLFDIDWDAFETRDLVVLTHGVAIDDAPRLSAREAAALIAGLQVIAALPGNADHDALGALAAKLARGAGSAPSPVAVARPADDDVLEHVRQSLEAGVRLRFDYRNPVRAVTEHRVVEPLRIESLDDAWYLRAWDADRAGVRTFRLDRMTAARPTDEPISLRPGDLVLPDVLFEPSPDHLAIEVDVADGALPLLADYRADGDTTRESPDRAGWSRVELRVASQEGLGRVVAGFSGTVVVVAPASARDEVARWAEAGLRAYGG